MAQYTIEDIEILRQKSGVSYEEAVNLLEYHNGSLARALVDMEKNGKLKSDAKSYTTHSAAAGSRGRSLFSRLYRTRIKVSKGSVPVVNVSLLFFLLMLFFSPWMLLIGAVLSLILGYHFGIERNSKDFGDSLDTIVKNAASNAKSTVYSMAVEITGKKDEAQPKSEPDQNRTEPAASGTTPVNVQFPGEGNVEVKSDSEGYHEADIQ